MYDDDVDDAEESSSSSRRKDKKRMVFTVWEYDVKNRDIPKTPVFECFENPIVAIRYVDRLNRRDNTRHRYFISPRPNTSSYIAAGVEMTV